jgi:hypothetical protein
MVTAVSNSLSHHWTQQVSQKPKPRGEDGSREDAGAFSKKVNCIRNAGANQKLSDRIGRSLESNKQAGDAKRPRLFVRFARALRAVFSLGKGREHKAQDSTGREDGAINHRVLRQHESYQSLDSAVIQNSLNLMAELRAKQGESINLGVTPQGESYRSRGNAVLQSNRNWMAKMETKYGLEGTLRHDGARGRDLRGARIELMGPSAKDSKGAGAAPNVKQGTHPAKLDKEAARAYLLLPLGNALTEANVAAAETLLATIDYEQRDIFVKNATADVPGSGAFRGATTGLQGVAKFAVDAELGEATDAFLARAQAISTRNIGGLPFTQWGDAGNREATSSDNWRDDANHLAAALKDVKELVNDIRNAIERQSQA